MNCVLLLAVFNSSYSKDVVLKKTLDSVLDRKCFQILSIKDEMILHISEIYTIHTIVVVYFS